MNSPNSSHSSNNEQYEQFTLCEQDEQFIFLKSSNKENSANRCEHCSVVPVLEPVRPILPVLEPAYSIIISQVSSLHLKVDKYDASEMVKAGDWWRGRSGGWFELIQLCQNRGKTLLSVPVVAIWPRHIPKFMFSMFSIFTPSAEIKLGLILESCLNSAVMIQYPVSYN